MMAFKIAMAVLLAALAGSGAELLPTGKAEPFNRVLDGQPVGRYQAGSLFSRDSSLSILWVENLTGNGTSLEKPLTLPESFRVMISDVAVGFDGTIAASASANDREGNGFVSIAWLKSDGSLIRVVRTTPFGARQVSFTADGSLWAIGMETVVEGVRKESPVHDVLRRYGPDGELLGTYLPRLSLSAGWPHPSHGGLLVTSKERVGFISEKAGKWAVLAGDGTILGQGAISAPEGFKIYVAAITDSGRLFVSGTWRGEKMPASGNFPRIPVFEIDPNSGELQLVDMSGALGERESANLIGADGEQLVFKAETAAGRQIKWMKVR